MIKCTVGFMTLQQGDKMKRVLLLIAMLLCMQSAFGSGKLIVGTKYFDNTQEFTPQFGLSIYERLIKNKLYLNAYAGVGQVPNEFEETTTWQVYKLNLDVPLHNWKWVVSGGVAHQFVDPWQQDFTTYEVKVSYKLW